MATLPPGRPPGGRSAGPRRRGACLNPGSRPAVHRADGDVVPLRQAGRVWLLISVQSFGGPGILAGGLVMLPGALAILALSVAYVAYGGTAVVQGLFLGLGPAVIGIVVQAVVWMSRRGLDHPGRLSSPVLGNPQVTHRLSHRSSQTAPPG